MWIYLICCYRQGILAGDHTERGEEVDLQDLFIPIGNGVGLIPLLIQGITEVRP